MKSLNCKNCGAAMYLDTSAMTAHCRFCGSKHMLNREDTDFFRDYYSTLTDLISPVKNEQQRKKTADRVWSKAQSMTFESVDGTELEIRYLHSHMMDGVKIYAARRNVVFHFAQGDEGKAERFRKTSSMLDYPSADTKKLSNFFPNIIGGFSLRDGSSLLVISKDENEYPLRLFQGLSGRHTAWIISRIENLCCVLEYSGLVHPQIGIDTLYINPFLHQANLYGGWWLAGRKNSLMPGGQTLLEPEMNLMGIRRTAANVSGYGDIGQVSGSERLPAVVADFIKGKPREDAYEDFALWDETLIKAYGERKFIEFDTDDSKIYGEG